MKKLYNNILIVLLFVSTLLFFKTNTYAYNYDAPISLSETEYNLCIDDIVPINILSDEYIDYSSITISISNPNVVSVYDYNEYDDEFAPYYSYFDDPEQEFYDDYYIYADRPGTCYITFSYGSQNLTCKVTVSKSYTLEASVNRFMESATSYHSIKQLKKFTKKWSADNQTNYKKICKYSALKNYCSYSHEDSSYKIQRMKKINSKTYDVKVKVRYQTSKDFVKSYNYYFYIGDALYDFNSMNASQKHTFINNCLSSAANNYEAKYTNKTITIRFVKCKDRWKAKEITPAIEKVLYSNLLQYME